MTSPLERYCTFFAGITPERLDEIAEYFTAEARFCDPFNDVKGPHAIRKIFSHMYQQVESPRFEILRQCGDTQYGFIEWRFHFLSQGQAQTFDGCSRVLFDEDGRVSEHVDFWDPTTPVYARIPVIRTLMRLIRSKLAA